MPDIGAILRLEPIPASWNGHDFQIARPTLADLVEAVDHAQKDPSSGRAWALHRHLRYTDGMPVFATVELAAHAPAGLAARFVPMIEALYNEGVD